MAGHSKWSNIKRAKGKTDAQRAKVFTKIGREIAVAVKLGGSDPSANSRLRDVIAKAKNANMPNDNIARGIKKASGELGSINFESITYEGYGIDGIAVIVEALTDNKNRTAGEVRHIFDKYGGGLGVSGSVSFLFETKGVLIIEKDAVKDNDTVMLDVLECGGQDISIESDVYEILTLPSDYNEVKELLENKGYKIISSSLEKIPLNYTDIKTPDKFNKMLDMFDDCDDVQEIYHNGKE